MEIRPATLADVPAMSRIHALSWKTAYRGMVPQQHLDELQEDRWVPVFEQSFADHTRGALLALLTGEPIGCVTYGPAREVGMQGWAEVPSIYVLPGHFGSGAGRLLLEHAFQQLREDGYSRVYLWVLEQNQRARAFYERRGMAWNGDIAQLEIQGQQLQELRYTMEL